MTALKGTKSPFASKGLWGAILMVVIPILGYFGYDVAKEDVTSLIAYLPAVFGGIVLGWKRLYKTVQGFDLTAWIIAIFAALGALYTAFTGDSELVDKLAPQIVAIFTAVSSILSAFGIHVATKEIVIE